MTMNIAPTAGIDISKDRLDVALHPSGETNQFANDRRGHGKLLRWLGKRDVAWVIFEATGAYGRELERRLEKSAVPFARVNPSIVSRRSIRSLQETRPAGRGGSCQAVRRGQRSSGQDRSRRRTDARPLPTPWQQAAMGTPGFGAALEPECRPLRSETLDQLAELVAARRAWPHAGPWPVGPGQG
jgi:transposase